MSKSYDLSTSSKWSALSDGEHTIQIVAKGTGYRDSAKSTSVTVTKGGSTGETWLLNSTLNATDVSSIINFVSNGTTYTNIVYDASGKIQLKYSGNVVYSAGSWTNEAYRTITFETAPTGDLLTWLQANGTKQ